MHTDSPYLQAAARRAGIPMSIRREDGVILVTDDIYEPPPIRRSHEARTWFSVAMICAVIFAISAALLLSNPI